MQVSVPQIAFDLPEQVGQIGAFIRVWVAEPFHILLHYGDAHRDMEPIQNMLRGRGHITGDVDDRIAAICHECDVLIFLPSLIFQDIVQSPFGFFIMALHKAKITIWSICRDGFADGDLKVRLTLFT